jgi:hypothetical protein
MWDEFEDYLRGLAQLRKKGCSDCAAANASPITFHGGRLLGNVIGDALAAGCSVVSHKIGSSASM